MFRFGPRRILRAVFVLLIAGSLSRSAAARVPARDGQHSRPAAPAQVLPLPGQRVSESIARFEVMPVRGASDIRIVVARVPFDPTGWSALPTGPAWTVLPYGSHPVAMAPLGLADRTDTPLWWAVVWTDAATGELHASEARTFTLVPRFVNRVAPDGSVRPSVTGRLPAPAATPGAPRPAIELAAGYTLEPGGPAPDLRAGLARTEGAPGGRGAYIVQFADESADLARARIEGAGGAIVSPIAGRSFLVRMDGAARDRLAQRDGQPWIASYEPAYKLSPALDRAAAGAVDATALLFADGDDDAVAGALRSLGAVNLKLHRGSLNHLARFDLDRSRLAEAAALADVAWIEPSPRDSMLNDQAQWVLQGNVPNSRPVWDHGLRGQGQVVMISDSGVRTNHEMFNDSTVTIPGWGDYPTHRKIIAYKPGSDDPHVAFGDNVENSYHGTHTSGTVAGRPGPYSTAHWSGMAIDAKLYFMDLAGPTSGGFYPPPDLNDLYQPSYTGNSGGAARISSNSWGSFAQGAYTLTAMQVDQFMWNHPDYLLTFASGNVGAFATVSTPGSAKNCLTVGATGNGPQANEFASFSSRGPCKDGRRKPTVMAPGHLVTSSVGSTRYSYATYSGTSMATPAAAGAMALVRQYLTEGWYPTGAPVAANAMEPSAALLKAMAIACSRNDVTGFRVPDNTIGYGRLTLDDVLHFPGDTSRTLLIDPKDGLEDGQFVEYQVQVTNPVQPLKIALCWTDAPGNPASLVQIVNDLDLVVSHGSATYRGNYILNYASVTGGWRDSLNLEELVRIPAPAPGLWTVRIEAKRIAQGPQPFALCLTGGVGGPAGSVALDRFQYALNDTVEIEVIDDDASSPLTVKVTSGSEPWNESVVLTGVGGVFKGSIPIAPVKAHLGDGVLAVSSDDVVTVIYTGASPATSITATARVSVQSPVVTNVLATPISSSQVRISWNTDPAATTRVHYGATLPMTGVADSSGALMTQHSVLLTGLKPGVKYLYDVESTTSMGAGSRDSLGGVHRTFTTRAPGDIALVMDDPSPNVAATWTNALEALGWTVDVLRGAEIDPPLIGDASTGLRRYNAVLWQVDPDRYPAFSDAQRTAIDSLLNGGGRLLVTGHDIGFSLADAGVFSYSPEREAWLESGLKSRYYYDLYDADTLSGLVGDPISAPWTAGTLYKQFLYPDAGDLIIPAPGTNGVGVVNWFGNSNPAWPMGLRWESNTPQGFPGAGVWGGRKSRLICMFFEWRGLSTTSVAHSEVRTAVLENSVRWLLERRPPQVVLKAPAPDTVVAGNFLPIRYSILPDSGRSIVSRALQYSLDGGATWQPLHTFAGADSGWIWDLGGALGGNPVPNSDRALLRVLVTDDGQPQLRGEDVMSGTFTLARPAGDMRGPVVVAGSASTSPSPLLIGEPATLFATFSDAETGDGPVAAAEYSIGESPAPGGGGTPMSATFGATTVEASAAIAGLGAPGTQVLWVRGQDAAGNWGPAAGFSVIVNLDGTVSVGISPDVDFLAAASPNPVRGRTSIRFGLARAGDARLELYDLAGRRVCTLASGTMPAGPSAAVWDGRDQGGRTVAAGVYFVRLATAARVFHSRVVVLN